MSDQARCPCVRPCELIEASASVAFVDETPPQISNVKDDANVVLSSREGPYQVGSTHKARVLEHSPFDGTIILSLQKSVLEQRFMVVSELKVGEIIKVGR